MNVSEQSSLSPRIEFRRQKGCMCFAAISEHYSSARLTISAIGLSDTSNSTEERSCPIGSTIAATKQYNCLCQLYRISRRRIEGRLNSVSSRTSILFSTMSTARLRRPRSPTVDASLRLSRGRVCESRTDGRELRGFALPAGRQTSPLQGAGASLTRSELLD